MENQIMQDLKEAVNEFHIITEGTGNEKQYYLDGKWMQSLIVNANRRMYQRTEMEEQMNWFNTNKIPNRKGVGELDHPEGTGINMHRISHVFESPLYMDKNDVCGKAKVLNTGYGQTLKVLIDEKIPFGVSSRGTGRLLKKEDYYEVQGFRLATPGDVVWTQSAPDAIPKAIIEMIMENDRRMMNIVDQQLLDETKKIIRSANNAVLTKKIEDQYKRIMESIK
jgi:hypothetical protein